MVTYFDDYDGTRKIVVPKYLDTPLGSRRILSGAARIDLGAPPPPPPPPPPPGNDDHILGMYPKVADSTIKSALGQLPRMLSTYHQPAEIMGQAWVALEDARMKAGIHVCHLYASVKDTTSNPTAARDNVLAMLAGNPPAGLVNYMTQSETLQRRYPNVSEVIHFTGEVEVGINQYRAGTLNGGYASLIEYHNGNLDNVFRDMGRYYQECFDLCDDIAPSVLRTFWMGGSTAGQNVAHRNTFYSQITNPPSIVPSDPYNNAINLNERPRDTWLPDINMYRSVSGVHHSHYVRWGQPPIALNETGISFQTGGSNPQPRYNDSQRATWIKQMVEDMIFCDLRHVIYFNSGGGNGTQYIIPGSFPLSVAAFAGEVTQDKQIAAG